MKEQINKYLETLQNGAGSSFEDYDTARNMARYWFDDFLDFIEKKPRNCQTVQPFSRNQIFHEPDKHRCTDEYCSYCDI